MAYVSRVTLPPTKLLLSMVSITGSKSCVCTIVEPNLLNPRRIRLCWCSQTACFVFSAGLPFCIFLHLCTLCHLRKRSAALCGCQAACIPPRSRARRRHAASAWNPSFTCDEETKDSETPVQSWSYSTSTSTTQFQWPERQFIKSHAHFCIHLQDIPCTIVNVSHFI